MADVKVTKKEYFGMLRNMVEGSGVENEDALLEFIDKEVASLEAKADKAKERAAKKREESDELRKEVLGLLTEEGQTGDELVAALGKEDVTKAKVVARLTQLIKDGKATKEVVRTEDKKRVTVYKVASAE